MTIAGSAPATRRVAHPTADLTPRATVPPPCPTGRNATPCSISPAPPRSGLQQRGDVGSTFRAREKPDEMNPTLTPVLEDQEVEFESEEDDDVESPSYLDYQLASIKDDGR